jgi:hypothetical protein
VYEFLFHLLKEKALNANRRVPADFPFSVTPHGVTKTMNWVPTNVSNARFETEKILFPRSRDQYKETPKPDILNIPKSPFLPP